MKINKYRKEALYQLSIFCPLVILSILGLCYKDNFIGIIQVFLIILGLCSIPIIFYCGTLLVRLIDGKSEPSQYDGFCPLG